MSFTWSKFHSRLGLHWWLGRRDRLGFDGWLGCQWRHQQLLLRVEFAQRDLRLIWHLAINVILKQFKQINSLDLSSVVEAASRAFALLSPDRVSRATRTWLETRTSRTTRTWQSTRTWHLIRFSLSVWIWRTVRFWLCFLPFVQLEADQEPKTRNNSTTVYIENKTGLRVDHRLEFRWTIATFGLNFTDGFRSSTFLSKSVHQVRKSNFLEYHPPCRTLYIPAK